MLPSEFIYHSIKKYKDIEIGYTKKLYYVNLLSRPTRYGIPLTLSTVNGENITDVLPVFNAESKTYNCSFEETRYSIGIFAMLGTNLEDVQYGIIDK